MSPIMYRSFCPTRLLRNTQAAAPPKPLRSFSSRPQRDMNKQNPPFITLDGRTGEGGGQIIRIATCLSALTGIPVHITNVRGNREKKNKQGGIKGGGLKAQHTTGVKALAQACGGTTENVVVGSTDFKFRPGERSASSPLRQTENDITISAASAASSMLVFQALFPYLLFSSLNPPAPIRLEIKGGTNVSFSPSFEYLDQVMLPMVEQWFGVPKVKRQLTKRGWAAGSAEVGIINFEFTPLANGQTLRFTKAETRGDITKIVLNILVPYEIRNDMESALRRKLEQTFPGRPIEIAVDERTEHPARIYVMLVAHTASGYRFAADCLHGKKTKGVSARTISEGVANELVNNLKREWDKGGDVDEHLQDQLVIFQALAEGSSMVQRKSDKIGESSAKESYSGAEPFGTGSYHTMTARWVANTFLKSKGVVWSIDGEQCEGVGWGKEGTTDR